MLGEKLEAEYINSQLGRSADVLFEEASQEYPGLLEGYSERYIRAAAIAEKNQMKRVTLKSIKGLTAFSE